MLLIKMRSKVLIYFLIFFLVLIIGISCHQLKKEIKEVPCGGIIKEFFGAEVNTTDDPLGGGEGYKRYANTWKYKVYNSKDLVKALKVAKPGETIYIEGSTLIDLSEERNLKIPQGITISSNRGRGDSQGALLFSNRIDTSPLIFIEGNDVRITGLRMRGPDPERRTDQMKDLLNQGKYYSLPNSAGIATHSNGLEVDNCELWGWSHAAILLRSGAKAYIHHNYIHHNQRYGLGYGICLNESEALIEANIFDWNRHAIAGTGRPGTSYEARFNLILENANSYSFDMHGGKDRQDGADIAGDWINIHHNTFRATDVKAIIINGKPRIGAEIHHNWFLHQNLNGAIAQLNATGNMHVYRNIFSEKRVLVE